MNPNPLAAVGLALALVCPALAEVTPLAHVEARGSGPVDMVLIPGLGMDWTVWDEFMERNKARYTMYAVTLPGFAGAAAPPVPDSNAGTPWMDNALAAIGAMIEERGLENPVVVGHSMGGMLAVRAGSEMADVVGPVVTVDGPPAFPLMGPNRMSVEQRLQVVDSMIAPQFFNMTDQTWQDTQSQMLGAVPSDERRAELAALMSKTPKEISARYLVEMMKLDVSVGLENADDPVMAIVSINEIGAAAGLGPDQMRAVWTSGFGDNLSKVTMVEFLDSQHFLLDERPEAIDATIAAFVRGDDDIPGFAGDPDETE